MPFKSEAQMRYLYAKVPSVAKRFTEEMKSSGKSMKALPEKVKKKKRKM
jgi:hypothetical protein